MPKTYEYSPWEGEGWQCTVPIRHGQGGSPILLSEVSSVRTTARNESTGEIVNSRDNQNMLNANNGVVTDGFFSFFFQPDDTTFVGDVDTTDQETHDFRVTFTLTDGTVSIVQWLLTCWAKPAIEMTVQKNIGRMISDLRNLINESDPTAIPDFVLYDYIQRGLYAVNAVTNYCKKNYTPAEQLIGPLIADQSEVAMPDELLSILLVYLGTNKMNAISFETLQERQVPFFVAQPGTPKNYVEWGREIYFDPAPDAAAVAATPYPYVRGVIAPPPFRLYGPYLLPTQYWSVPLWHAAWQWFSGPLTARKELAAAQQALYVDGVKSMAENYAGRQTS